MKRIVHANRRLHAGGGEIYRLWKGFTENEVEFLLGDILVMWFR